MRDPGSDRIDTGPGRDGALRDWLARTRRYVAVSGIFVRHGLGRFAGWGGRAAGITGRQHTARAFARALEDAGPTYVKLGQFLSARPELLPPDFVAELTSLQSDVRPVAWDEIEKVLQAELGDDLDDLFAYIEPRPLAAASLAQVHRARLRDGREVVVKVQRPGVRSAVRADLDIIMRLARRVQTRTTWGADLGAAALAAGFADSIREELDYTVERANMLALAGSLPPATTEVHLPLPRARHTGRVLVMDHVAGVTVGGAGERLAALGPARRTALGAALVRVMLHQILAVGVFHTDLHPGNLVLADAGGLAMLDCGSVGRVDSHTRETLALLFWAIDKGDAVRACDALLAVTDAPAWLDEPALRRDLGRVLVRYTAPGATVGADAVTEVFRIVHRHHLGIPPEVAAVFRSMATLDGTLRVVDPDANLLAAARAFGQEQFAATIDPTTWQQAVTDEIVRALPLLRAMPRRISRIAAALESGQLEVRMRASVDDAAVHRAARGTQMSFLAVLGVTTFVTGIWLATDAHPGTVWGMRTVVLGGGALLLLGATLLTRVLYAAVTFHHRPPGGTR